MNKISESLQWILDEFSLLNNQQERYRQLIQLAKRLPEMSSSLKKNTAPLDGCESDVWLSLTVNQQGLLEINADSSARIIKGLLTIIYCAYQRQTPQYILAFNLDKLFQQLKINDSLTSSKENGIKLISNTISDFCDKYKFYQGQLE